MSKNSNLTYMLDTNICIYVMKNKNDNALQKFKDNFYHLCISIITYAELKLGVEKSEQVKKNSEALEKFVQSLPIIPFNVKAANEYGYIRAKLEKEGRTISGNDMLIAASAKAENVILVTNNVREFERVDGLKIEDWTK